MAVSETAKLIAELGFNDKLTPGVNKALGSVGRLEKGIGRAGKGTGQLASGMARAGTIIAGAAVTGLGAAAKAAIDWEDAFAGVVKTVDEADLNKAGLTFRDLELSLRKMSTTMPTTAAELAAIAEAGGAMGVAGKDIEEFTRVVALLGATTNITVEDAATALGQMQSVIGLTADEFDNFSAALVDLGNKGSSTEAQILEIARRSGGAAKLIGIAKEATLGWAAAAANLGLNEELAGTAVQNFFLKTQNAITAGGADLKDLAKISGVTTKQFKKNFDKNASGTLENFLKGLGEMPKDARLKAVQNIFGKGSGLTRLIIGLSDSIDENLTPSLDTSAEAWKENTAATAEFEKRNATVRSGFARLKNSIVDAAITLGEGFAPALGRSAAKLSEFLAQDENRNQLKAIGEDIGKAIDDIDWGEVLKGAREFVTVMKVALSFAKRLFDAVNALPTEIKAAGLGLIGLNKLSGGLVGAGVGNIVGGLGEALAKSLAGRIPILGKAFVQPVFVTNMGGLGGGGVAGAAGKGLSGLSKVFLVGEAIGLALMVEEFRTGISSQNSEFAGVIETQTQKFIASQPDRTALENALAGVDQGIADLTSNPLNVLVQGDALTKLQQMRADLAAALERSNNRGVPGPVRNSGAPSDPFARPDRDDAVKASIDKTTTAVETMRGNIGADLGKVNTATIEAGLKAKNAGDATKSAVLETKSAVNVAGLLGMLATTTAGLGTQSAVRNVAPPIVSALRSMPTPQTFVTVNVSATHVTKSTTIQKRYGPGNGSSGQNQRSGELEF